MWRLKSSSSHRNDSEGAELFQKFGYCLPSNSDFLRKKWQNRRHETNLSYFLILTLLLFDIFPKLFLIENHKSAKFSDILFCRIEKQ